MIVFIHVHVPSGDPTVFGNLPQSVTCEDAVQESIVKRTCNGYCPSVGELFFLTVFRKLKGSLPFYISTMMDAFKVFKECPKLVS